MNPFFPVLHHSLRVQLRNCYLSKDVILCQVTQKKMKDSRKLPYWCKGPRKATRLLGVAEKIFRCSGWLQLQGGWVLTLVRYIWDANLPSSSVSHCSPVLNFSCREWQLLPTGVFVSGSLLYSVMGSSSQCPSSSAISPCSYVGVGWRLLLSWSLV